MSETKVFIEISFSRPHAAHVSAIMQELRELRLEATGARRREGSLKDAHAARIMQLEREIQKLRPAALHAKELEARLADREQRVEKLRAEVPFACARAVSC